MNSALDFAGLAAVILAVLSVWKSLSTRRSDKTKSNVEVAESLQDLIDTTTRRNIDLYARQLFLEGEVQNIRADLRMFLKLHEEWSDGIALLLTQLRRSKAQPIWEPDVETIAALNKLKEKYGESSRAS